MQTTKKNWEIIHNIQNALVYHNEPIHLTHFVTERCNAKCPHCFIDFNKQNNELTLEQIEKISSTCGNSLRNVSVTGGEPFIREDIFEIVDIWYQNSTAKSIAICTNGSMPDKIEKFVVQANKKHLPLSFFFSYDFINEKYSEYRNIKDLHLKVLESYKIVHNFYPKMNATFNITVSENNYASAFETYKYIRDVLKIQNINCTLMRGEKMQNLSQDVKNQIAEAYSLIQKSINSDFDNGLIDGYTDKSLTSTVLNAKNKIVWKYVLDTFKRNCYISPCFAGALFGVIFSNGDVYPCELLTEKAGSLKDFGYNFSELWQSENAKTVRNKILSSKCYCTFECTWLINLFSSPRYYLQIFYNIINNVLRRNL